jgi:hypothetical protein
MCRISCITVAIAVLLAAGCGTERPAGPASEGPSSSTGTPASRWEGKLVVASNDQKIYLIQNGRKRWITSPDVMQKHGFRWDAVNRVPPAELAALPEGEPVQ